MKAQILIMQEKLRGKNKILGRSIMNAVLQIGVIPVSIKIHNTQRDRDISFKMTHGADGGEVGYKWVCRICNQELAPEDIVKAFDVGDGKLVSIPEIQELKTMIKGMQLLGVQKRDVPHHFISDTYLLSPNLKEKGERNYAILVNVLSMMDKEIYVRYVARGSEKIGRIRVFEGRLMLDLIPFADKILDVESVEIPQSRIPIKQGEIDLVKQYIEKFARENQFSYEDESSMIEKRVNEAIGEAIEKRTDVTIVVSSENTLEAQLKQILGV